MGDVELAAFPSRLIDGYQSFRQGRFQSEQLRFQRLAEAGQRPQVMIVGCCDSRVSPEVIFDAGPGEMFVVRNVANLIPPYSPDGDYHGTSAALEFAVVALKVKHIVVMGHGRCGGIHAALHDDEEPLTSTDFIGRWMSMTSGIAERIKADPHIEEHRRQTVMEHAVIRQSLANLMTFPCVQIRTGKGSMKLHGAWFDVGLGELHVLDQQTGSFHLVSE